jgi:hypothetical protein
MVFDEDHFIDGSSVLRVFAVVFQFRLVYRAENDARSDKKFFSAAITGQPETILVR